MGRLGDLGQSKDGHRSQQVELGIKGNENLEN